MQFNLFHLISLIIVQILYYGTMKKEIDKNEQIKFSVYEILKKKKIKDYTEKEFEDLKEELLSTINELTRSKNDIEQRSRECFELNEKYLSTIEDLKKANEIAIENEQKFRKMFKESSIGVAVVSLDNRFISANETYCEMLGYTEHELIGKKLIDVTHPEIIEKNIELQKQLNEGLIQSFQLEKKFIHKNGHIVYGLLNSTLIRNNKNEPLYFLGNIQDITEIKLVEQELIAAKEKAEDNERRFRTLFENSPIGKSMTALDGSIYVNKSFCEMLGYTESELKEKKWKEITYHDDIEMSEKAIKRLLEESIEKVRIEKRYLHKSGEVIWADVFVFLQRDFDGKPQYFITSINNVTQQKKTEQELQASKEKAEQNERMFSAALESMADAVFISDTEGNFIKFNQAFVTYHKFKDISESPKVLNEYPKYIEVYTSDDKLADLENWAVPRALRGETGTNVEYKLKRIDTNEEWVGSYNFAPIINKTGNIVGSVVTGRDVTKNKQYEELILKAKEKAEESDRLKSAFLQNMSHEIRTPMNAIIGFSELINSPEISEEKRKSYSVVIQNSSHQLLTIVNDILTISSLETKLEKVNIQPTNINSIYIQLMAVFKIQASNKHITLVSKQQLADKESEIYTDKTKLTQILTNLISNAIKFTHEGFVEFGYALKENILEFYVKDTGIGIRKEFQNKIFERFRQADNSISNTYGGTGLGLAICKGFAQLLNGDIWVKSEPGKGSVFYFTIPFNPVNVFVVNKKNEEINITRCAFRPN